MVAKATNESIFLLAFRSHEQDYHTAGIHVSCSRAAFAAALVSRSSFGDDTPPPPTVEITNPRRIADGVWIIPDHRIWLVPNIGVVVGKDAALVIDTGLGPANGEKVLELARSIGGKRRLLLTVTHFHPEHGYGCSGFSTGCYEVREAL